MSTKAPTVGVVSLGCPKALVDSERIITRLRSEGYQLSGDYAIQLDITAAPEPGTWALMLAGLGALFLLRKRRSILS